MLKGSGVELTQFWAQARYAPDWGTGGSVSYRHFTWPETKRVQFEDLDPALIIDGRLDRFDLRVWYGFTNDFKLTARADYWSDHNRDGLGGELTGDWTNSGGTWPDFTASAFYTEGSFNDGVGLRFRARKQIRGFNGFLGYELFNYTAKGGHEYLTRHSISAGLGWTAGRWNYSLNGDYYFGDGQGSYTLGAYVGYRF